MDRGLAFDGDVDMGIFFYKAFQIRKQDIFAEGIADADGQMADMEIMDPL